MVPVVHILTIGEEMETQEALCSEMISRRGCANQGKALMYK